MTSTESLSQVKPVRRHCAVFVGRRIVKRVDAGHTRGIHQPRILVLRRLWLQPHLQDDFVFRDSNFVRTLLLLCMGQEKALYWCIIDISLLMNISGGRLNPFLQPGVVLALRALADVKAERATAKIMESIIISLDRPDAAAKLMLQV